MTPSTAPVADRVHAYFAPVDRNDGSPAIFDPAQSASFLLDAPLAPWVDLGCISQFVRTSGTKYEPLLAGSPATPIGQVRTQVEASVAFEFDGWGKLQAALASGSQQTNLLATAPGAAPNGSGGTAEPPFALLTASGPPSTATALNVGPAAAAQFTPGTVVAVDIDYTGQTGFVGSGISAAYVRSAAAVASDINYIRRVTLNVGVVESVTDGVLQLATPLPAGTPSAEMQVSRVLGFCDREGASFFQEWSALFVLEGLQGDRVFFHYPRLQPMQASSERAEPLPQPGIAHPAAPQRIRLAAAFRALPVRDPSDGESVVCFRSYLPAPHRAV